MYQDRYDLEKWKDKNSKTNRYAYDSGNMTNTAFYLQDEYKVSDDMTCLLYTSPSPRDRTRSRMPSSA